MQYSHSIGAEPGHLSIFQCYDGMPACLCQLQGLCSPPLCIKACIPGMHSGQQLCLQACILCGTTETPLWRANDIDGVKNVCNACGVRQNRLKRARRADDAARQSSSNQGRLQLPAQNSSTSYSSPTQRAASVSFLTQHHMAAKSTLALPASCC